MVKFILGRRKSGKTHNLIENMKKHIDDKKICYYLVPEQSTLENEYHLIKEIEIIGESKVDGLIDIQVVSFTKLANLVLKKSKIRNMKILSDVGQQIVLRKAINDLDLLIFKNPKEKELEELSKLINQIREIDDIENIVKTIADDKLKNKIEEIILIKDKYLSFIDEDYIDKISYLDYLVEEIKRDESLKESYFYLDDFNNLTSNQLDILKALIKVVKEVKIAFNIDLDDYKYFEPTYSLFLEIKNFLEEEKIAYEVSNTKEQYYNSKELLTLENKLSKFKVVPYKEKVEDIYLSEFINVDGEVNYLFKSIIKLINEEGYNYKDIKVICNDIEGYRHYLKLYRKLYDVPLFIDEKLNLHNHPIVRIILDIVLLKEDYHTDVIMDLLRTGYFSFNDEELSRIENYAYSYGIDSFKWKKIVAGDSDRDKEIEVIRNKIITLIDEVRDIFKGSTVKEKIVNLYNTLAHLKIYEELSSKIEVFKEGENYNNIYYNTQAWNAILDVFNQMYSFIGSKQIDNKELHRYLKESLGLVNISLLPIKNEEVLVMDSSSSIKEKSKVTFLLGFNEGFYPLKLGSDPIFPLEQEEYLTKKFKWSRSNDISMEMKNLDVYSSLTMGSDKLYISYHEMDNNGESLKPAYILKHILRKFPKLDIDNPILDEDRYFYSYDILFINILKNIIEEKVWNPRVLESFNNKRRMLINNIIETKDIEEGIVSDNIIKNVIFKNDIPVFSISKLETYGKCPYQYYIKNILRPLELKEFQLASIDIGNIFHNVLEKGGRLGVFSLDNHEKVEEIIDSTFTETVADNSLKIYDTNYFNYQLEMIKEESSSIIEAFKYSLNEDSFKPAAYELEFGINKELPSYIIDIDKNRKIQIEGKVDRLDTYKDGNSSYLKIMDYKLSGKNIDLNKVIDGISFQLFVYIKGILAGMEGNHRAGGLFYSNLVKNIDVEGKSKTKIFNGLLIEDEDDKFNFDKENSTVTKLSEKAYDKLNNLIFKNIKNYVTSMLNGDFKAYPYSYSKDDVPCKYCSYSRLCGSGKDNIRICRKIEKKKILERLEDDDKLDF